MRILDIDLDFFVENPVIMPGDGRPDVAEHSIWSASDARAFLRNRCGLEGPLPGFVTERHHEAFAQWRAAIQAGRLTASFHVTHLDAHADLGMGDSGHVHLMELLQLPPVARLHPRIAADGDWGDMQEGNYLLFAIACRWLSSLEYVHPHGRPGDVGRPGDLHYWYMANFDPTAGEIVLPHIPLEQIHDMGRWRDRLFEISEWEPAVPFNAIHRDDFQATAPYDAVCLTRSPQYSPAEADELFDEIRREFIDERQWGVDCTVS